MDREDRIRRRAYDLWVSEGRPEGRDIEHWQQASEQIDSEDRSLAERGGGDSSAGGLSSGLQPGGTGKASPGSGVGSIGSAGGQTAGKASGNARKRK